jgi:hypothetical protein
VIRQLADGAVFAILVQFFLPVRVLPGLIENHIFIPGYKFG